MTEEIAVRIQRMQGAYAKYDKGSFSSSFSDWRKVDLFNAIVVMNGLFGCQVWNVTQTHVDDLEAVHSKLVRRILKMNKLEWGRGALMEYVEERKLHILPIEWRMMKLQLRYAGHEVRVAQDDVHRAPHNMLFRGYGGGGPKLPGGLEQAYPATIRKALAMCGLKLTRWVELAKKKDVWKKVLDGYAKQTFLKNLYARENVRREQRRKGEERRLQKEEARITELASVMVDSREDMGEMDESMELDVGVESSDNSDGESEGEDWGSAVMNHARRVVTYTPLDQVIEGIINEQPARQELNAMASKVFMDSLGYQVMEDVEIMGIEAQQHRGIESADRMWHIGNRESFQSKRKQYERDRRRLKRNNYESDR